MKYACEMAGSLYIVAYVKQLAIMDELFDYTKQLDIMDEIVD